MKINLMKLIIGMQIQLHSIQQQAREMREALEEITKELEHPRIEQLPEPIKVRKHNTEPAQAALAKKRIDPAYLQKLSERQRAYWASPRGQERRAKGKSAVFHKS